jgi:hypothetical protein
MHPPPSTVRPPHVVAYPLLYNHRAVVNDYLLREAFELFRSRGGEARFTPPPEWTADCLEHSDVTLSDGGGVMMFMADQGIEHVGGMLLAGGKDFLFDCTPFILKRDVDVRCRFGYSGTVDIDALSAEAAAAAQIEASGGFKEDIALGASAGESTSPGSIPMVKGPASVLDGSASVAAAKHHQEAERARVHFWVTEHVGISDDHSDWVVQTFQLIGRNGRFGRVLYRAHATAIAANRFKNERLQAAANRHVALNGGHGGTTPGSPGEGFDSGVATRMPVAGEERLKIENPELYAFVLLRDPVEMGSAARVIINTIEYFKYSFTVIRTIRSLMRAIKTMQRFARKMLANRLTTELRMIRDWDAQERDFKRRLQAHQSLPGDEVDRIVNKLLLRHCLTPREYKRDIIRGIWESRKRRYISNRAMGGKLGGIVDAFTGHFTWSIDVGELVAYNQRRLVDLLSSNSKDSVFHHPKVQTLFIDSVGEQEILQQAVTDARNDQLARLNGRRVPAFGSTAGRFGGAEPSLELRYELGERRPPSWDPSYYVDERAADIDEDGTEEEAESASPTVAGGTDRQGKSRTAAAPSTTAATSQATKGRSTPNSTTRSTVTTSGGR